GHSPFSHSSCAKIIDPQPGGRVIASEGGMRLLTSFLVILVLSISASAQPITAEACLQDHLAFARAVDNESLALKNIPALRKYCQCKKSPKSQTFFDNPPPIRWRFVLTGYASQLQARLDRYVEGCK